MFAALPKSAQDFSEWGWTQIEPYYKELAGRRLTAGNVDEWLADWTRLADLIGETFNRLYVAKTLDTNDPEIERRFNAFLENIYPQAEAADQQLKQALLVSGLEPAGFQVPLRNMRADADLFREANLPLLVQEQKLDSEYNKIVGAQTVEWEGQELTVQQLVPVYQNPDRQVRERAWRLGIERQLADRDAINELWGRFMTLRGELAANAGKPDYRAYRWQELLRFDYSPDDCKAFHEAIYQVVVPAAARVYEKRRRQLGLKTLRPWDLTVDPLGRPALQPFKTVEELTSTMAAMFERTDPQLGAYFGVMRREGLLDLDNRKGKAPGGYCTAFQVVKRPFIFMNAVGVHNDVQTLMHESGHAFHVFEQQPLPYHQQHRVGEEFGEVASMSMELLAAPYLAVSAGGFYSDQDAARARIEHLESNICFWPYMAVVDAFQQWVYENHAQAMNPAACDDRWGELWQRFMPGVDWSGLDDAMRTGWHRKLHIHQVPFYYVEYGMAQLGAVQVWRNALHDQAGAVGRYRQALALGGTATLPELYKAAGARFAFDAEILGQAVELMERTIEELEAS